MKQLWRNSSLQQVHFIVTILFVLTLVSDIAVLYGNDAFSILVLSTEKWCSSFLKTIFVFQKICFKVKVLKIFKIFTDCHIKTSFSSIKDTINIYFCYHHLSSLGMMHPCYHPGKSRKQGLVQAMKSLPQYKVV